MALTTIKHKGKIIYYNDWRNLKNVADFKIHIESTNEDVHRLIKEGKTDILALADVTNSFLIGETLQLIKESGKLSKKITRKSAAIGLSLAKRVILNSVNRFGNTNIKAFDNIEEAKEWLVSE